jgi:hypothetical protein
MNVHRLRSVLELPGTAEEVSSTPPFVPCPVVLLQGYSAPQLQQIQEIYRLARESVEAARPPRRLPFPPAFSLN